MKTCRFCNFQQESGDFCESCGSPFPADKLDFSEGLPEVNGGFPDPTASSIPDPTASPAPAAAPVVAAAVEPPAPSETPAEDPEAASTPEEKPESPKDESSSERKVMYSAAVSGETVYLKSKGGYHPKSTGESLAGLVMPESVVEKISNARKNAVPEPTPVETPAAAPQPTYTAPAPAPVPTYTGPTTVPTSQYKGIYMHSMIVMILSAVGLVCCCGMSTPSFVLSMIAFLKVQSLKNGAQAQDPEKIVNRAKMLTDTADVLLIVAAIIMFIVIFVL